jgi:preprotein translocase subunit SecD
MMDLRDNWRLVLLAVLIVLASVALFVPGTPAGSADSGEASQAASSTNLQYGIQLSGGTRIRAPPVGITAEEVQVSRENETALGQSLANRLEIDGIDVKVSNQTNAVEVFTKSVSQDELRAAIEAEGYDPSEVRAGVTEETLDEMVESVDRKLSESALSSGSVQKVTLGGRQIISITAPDRDREQLVSILEDRGVVRMYAVTEGANGTTIRTQMLSQEDFTNIGTARVVDQEAGVPVSIIDERAGQFADEMVELGFGDGSTCEAGRETHESLETVGGDCWVATLDGEPVFVGGVTPGLGEDLRSGDFEKDPTFRMTTGDIETARDLELDLKAGRLAAPLDFENSESRTLSPALADRFKTNSLIVGILAVIAVSLVVYWRYRRPEVAAPMVVTAMSEVYLLLGFVAFVQYPLNLSHIAGFIAVIGTGVDDLVIIADEILQQGDVATGRVFQSRFRKAFWVIGAAAATTIVAMSPLTVLALGDLSGFAIITIVGVLIGVFITRPAYGDILRNLVLARRRD